MSEPVVVAPANVEPVKFKLSAPIATHQGLTDVLELKQPKVGAFVKYGAPWKEFISGPPNDRRTHFEYNYAAVLGFVQEATGHDQIILGQIQACDMFPLAVAMVEVIQTRNPK